MHRTLPARWLNRALRIGELPSSNSVPLYLCPSLASSSYGRSVRSPNVGFHAGNRTSHYSRGFHSDVLNTHVEPTHPTPPEHEPGKNPDRKLPRNCSGCGAFTQTSDPSQFGYVNPQSKRIRSWLAPEVSKPELEATQEADVITKALEGLDAGQREALGLDPASLLATETPAPQTGMASHVPAPSGLCSGSSF
jgi:hypothetical protein